MLKEDTIDSLELSTRAINALEGLGISKVAGLKSLDINRLGWTRNVGRKTFLEIMNILEKVEGQDLTFDTEKSSQPIGKLISNFLNKIGRNEGIFIRRTGLLDGKEETLESIGHLFGLTRERVRQIEKKVTLRLRKIIRRESKIILDIIYREINKQIVLSTEEIFSIYCNLVKEDYNFSKNAIVNIIIGAIGEGVRFINSSGNLWTNSIRIADLYPKIIRIARKNLSGVTIDLESLALEVSREIGFRERSEIEAIKKILCASNRFLNIGEIQELYSLNGISPKSQSLSNMRKDFAYFYIKQQGVPVNLREIFRAMQEKVPHLIPKGGGISASLRVLDSNLERDKRLAWAGESIFALVEWGYEHEVTTIDKAIKRLLSYIGRPISTREISNQILKLYQVSEGSISAALKREEGKRFRRIKAGIWTLI